MVSIEKLYSGNAVFKIAIININLKMSMFFSFFKLKKIDT